MFEYLKTAFYNNFVVMDRWKIILSGFGLTIKLSMLSFIFGTLLACILCAGSVCKVKWINKVIRIYNGLVNKIPHMVILMLLYYVVLADVAVSAEIIAVIGLTMRIASTLSDNFESVLRGIQKGEIEAARTLGMSAYQAFMNVTMPQVIRAVSPLYRIQFVLAVQMTSVVSILSLMDLTRSVNVVAAYTFDPYIGVIVTTVVYILVGYIGDLLIGLFARERHTYVKGVKAA